MAYCPNCATELEATVERCHECEAVFGQPGGWNPVNTKPRDGRIVMQPVGFAKPASEAPGWKEGIGAIVAFLVFTLVLLLVVAEFLVNDFAYYFFSLGGHLSPLVLLLTPVLWLVALGFLVRFLWRVARSERKRNPVGPPSDDGVVL